MAGTEKKQVAKPAAAPEPVIVIDIVRGERRRQCAQKDFPYFDQRGWKKADTGTVPPPAGTPNSPAKENKTLSAAADK